MDALGEVVVVIIDLVHHASVIVVAGLRICSSIHILMVALVEAQLHLVFVILNDILLLFVNLLILYHQFVFLIVVFAVLAQEIRWFLILTLDTL